MSHYSNSQINTYFRCPRQYKLQYIDKVEIPKLAKGIEALMGSSIHEALYELYKQAKLGKVITLEECKNVYLTHFNNSLSEELIIPKPGVTPEHYIQNGLLMIQQYYESNYPFSKNKTVDLEYRIHFDIGPFSFVGIIDRLALNDDGVFEIHDYKTSLTLPTLEQIQDDTQLALYLIGIKQKYGAESKATLFWHFLYYRHTYELTKTDEELHELEQDMVKKIRSIERDPYYLPCESPLCNWCSYTEFCPAKNPYLHSPASPDDIKETIDEYVHQWRFVQKMKQETKAAETLLTEKEKLILEYAKEHHLTELSGTDVTIPISESWQYQFPSSNDKGRKEFECWLKEHHLWDEVSSFNTLRLNKLLKDGSFDTETYQSLMEFSQMVHKQEIKKIIFPENKEDK